MHCWRSALPARWRYTGWCCASKGLWGLTQGAQEGATHLSVVGETCSSGDLVEGAEPTLDGILGSFNAQTLHRLRGRGPDFSEEGAGEGGRAQCGPLGALHSASGSKRPDCPPTSSRAEN